MTDFKQQELSRFTGSGKTFFLNKGKARNGTDYLAINAVYGQGRQERLVLFPPHYLEFYKHLKAAIEQLTGFQASQPSQGAPPLALECLGCGSGAARWEVKNYGGETGWWVICECGHVLYKSRDD